MSKTETTMIRNDEQRIGQYATRQRAQRAAKAERRAHRVILTTCYRVDGSGYPAPRMCWATYLDMGLRDAQHRAWGSK